MPTEPTDFKELHRFENPGDARFLTCTCFHGQAFLRSERACRWFVDALAAARVKHLFALWAWCIMPTHFHLLLVPQPFGSTVPMILTSLKQSVSRRAVAWVKANAPEFLPRMLDAQPNGNAC